MTKREIALLTLLSGILLVLAGVLINYRIDLAKVDRIVRKKKAFESFLTTAIKVRDIWSQGDIKGLIGKGKLKCLKEFGQNKAADPTFYRCNPDYLNCFIRESGLDQVNFLSFSGSKYVKVLASSLMPGAKIPHYGVLVNIGVGEFSFPLVLKDSCLETFLPQRIFAYGPYKKGKIDWKWDNFNQLIMVDRHLVTKRDYLEWTSLLNKKLKTQLSPEDLSLPVTDLLPGEMSEFCAFRGKQVISSPVFDASTFYPGNLQKPKPFKVFRSPYPWSRQRIDSFLYRAKRYADFTFKKEYCLKAYTFECTELLNYSDFQFKSNSWIGLSNVLGGKMQYIKNPIEPVKNLWVSSSNFPATSDSHQIGLRDSWDERGFGPNNLNLVERPNIEPKAYEIGFRCMRYLPNAK